MDRLAMKKKITETFFLLDTLFADVETVLEDMYIMGRSIEDNAKLVLDQVKGIKRVTNDLHKLLKEKEEIEDE